VDVDIYSSAAEPEPAGRRRQRAGVVGQQLLRLTLLSARPELSLDGTNRIHGRTHTITAPYSFTDPKKIKG